MSKYTKALTAEQLIQYIAIDRPEMSHDKVKWQRDHYIKICLEWLEENVNILPENDIPKDKDVST